jgi:hypothetical protein
MIESIHRISRIKGGTENPSGPWRSGAAPEWRAPCSGPKARSARELPLLTTPWRSRLRRLNRPKFLDPADTKLTRDLLARRSKQHMKKTRTRGRVQRATRSSGRPIAGDEHGCYPLVGGARGGAGTADAELAWPRVHACNAPRQGPRAVPRAPRDAPGRADLDGGRQQSP